MPDDQEISVPQPGPEDSTIENKADRELSDEEQTHLVTLRGELDEKNTSVQLMKREYRLIVESQTKNGVIDFEGVYGLLAQREEEQSGFDEFTGLESKLSFERQLPIEIKLAQRSGEPFCIFVLDANNFKVINDTLGHPVGDEVILAITNALMQGLRESDSKYRIGGDENAGILRDVGLKGATEVIARMQESLSGQVTERLSSGRFLANAELAKYKGSPLIKAFTATIGVAQYDPNKDETWQDLYKRADEALFAAKTEPRGNYIGVSEFDPKTRVYKPKRLGSESAPVLPLAA